MYNQKFLQEEEIQAFYLEKEKLRVKFDPLRDVFGSLLVALPSVFSE